MPVRQFSLPVNVGDGLVMDPAKAREVGARLAETYCTADPYPHIVIDDFLPEILAEGILRNFPIATKSTSVVGFQDRTFEHKKRQILPADCNEYVRGVFNFFNSAPVLAFLESLTRIEGLISDPYFEGGGFHEISREGKLGLHADFRIHRKLRLNRRLNLLIYLNKNWKEEYRGHLEFWDKSAKHKVRSVAPLFNRCVVFNTAKDSYHGHPDPLNVPEDRTRKSMALYYYTASERIYEETPAHGTAFVARPDDGADAKRRALKLKIKNHFSLVEVLPPMLYRALRTVKYRVKPPR
jgi:2OG-Fe(II) oxygenase superfamily